MLLIYDTYSTSGWSPASRVDHLPISLLYKTVIPSSSLYSELSFDLAAATLLALDTEFDLDLALVLRRGVEVPEVPSLKELFRLPILLLWLLRPPDTKLAEYHQEKQQKYQQ